MMASCNVTKVMDMEIQPKEAYASPAEEEAPHNGISEAQILQRPTMRAANIAENAS